MSTIKRDDKNKSHANRVARENILEEHPPAMAALEAQAAASHDIDLTTSRGRNEARALVNGGDTNLSAKMDQLVQVRVVYEGNKAALGKLREMAETKAKESNPDLSGASLNNTVNGLLAQGELKLLFDALKTKIAPTEEEAGARAERYGKNDGEKAQYTSNVNGWLTNLKSLEQLNLQSYQKVMHKIAILDVGPGDPYLRKESLPESVAHSNTLPRQGIEDLNGIKGNRGDINVFHAGMAINEAIGELMKQAAHDSGVDPDKPIVSDTLGRLATALKLPAWQREKNQLGNAFKDFENLVDAIKHAKDTGQSKLPNVPVSNLLEATSQLGEMRGGLGSTNAMRALIQSFQEGAYWFYRAKSDLGQAKGEIAALVAKIFANDQPDENGNPTRKPLKYSTAILGGSMLPGAELRMRTAEGDRDAMRVAADPEKMPQEIDRTSEFMSLLAGDASLKALWNGMSSDEKKNETAWPPLIKSAATEAKQRADTGFRENAHYLDVRGKHRAGGDTCSTFLVRTAQTAKLQEAVAIEFEKFADNLRANDKNITGREIALALIKEFDLPTGGALKVDSDMSSKVQEICKRAMDNDFRGLLDNKPEGMAPMSIEHELRNDELYDFVGVLCIEADEVLNVEQNFDKKTGLPSSSRYPYLDS